MQQKLFPYKFFRFESKHDMSCNKPKYELKG